ncbi:hypothetical protein K2173_008030 [Erythroxylum novogranatense]|uniref:Cirhin n=1 Tax=Erythroxylum novogranatense TaxID=1862640 RepID=A0AAV8T731_9ROSI|nr:hypothetical protein K2173_008030 [Erythroxylum novogranatense]
MVEAAYRNSSIDWRPSAVVALATSVDDSQVAAAREDGTLEIGLFLLTPSAGCYDPGLLCQAGSGGWPCGRFFSSSIDGSISEWDLFHLKQKNVLECIGVSIWQMAVAPSNDTIIHTESELCHLGNGYLKHTNDHGDYESSDSDSDSDSDNDSGDDCDSDNLHKLSVVENPYVAIACDDGCVRLYTVPDSDELIYYGTLPRVSVTWSPDANRMYCGSSNGCWDAKMGHEIYRITVGLSGLGSGPELCVWLLLALRCGTLVSADSNGSVPFWDDQQGTLLQSHSSHKGDVNTLAAAPTHNRVFSAGSDGQVILYKLSSETIGSSDDTSPSNMSKKWVYVGYVRAHTHDVRALTIAVPISHEDPLPDEKVNRLRSKKRPIEFSYHKWARLGVPMLISAGDDTKLFAYSAKEFSRFSPHDICPAPQRPLIQLVLNTLFDQNALLLVQGSCTLNILCVCVKNGALPVMGSGPSKGCASTDLVARIKTKASSKIISSAISNAGTILAYSDHLKPKLFELKKNEAGKGAWIVRKNKLPSEVPSAHSMIFSSDSSHLMVGGHDRRIYVIDVGSSKLLHTFIPCSKENAEELSSTEPPITKMYTSCDGQWLAAINCFGDVYIFNLETQRQHWFIARLDGASVTAAGFPPHNNNVLVLATSSNQVYAFDVEAKQLGGWSMRHTFVLPRRYQEFPGEVIGLSFLLLHVNRLAICLIDFGMPMDRVEDGDPICSGRSPVKKLQSNPINGKFKRRLKHCQMDAKYKRNFEFVGFRDPVLFIGHLSENSILIIDKPRMDVVKTFEAPHVHRHVFGT